MASLHAMPQGLDCFGHTSREPLRSWGRASWLNRVQHGTGTDGRWIVVRCTGSGAERGGRWDNVGRRRWGAGRGGDSGWGFNAGGFDENRAGDPTPISMSLSERRRQLQEVAAKMGDPLRDMVAVASRRLQQYFDTHGLNKGGDGAGEGGRFADKTEWEIWQEVIAEVEEREVMLSVLRSQMGDAVDAEEFKDAAALREAIKELERQDDMRRVFNLLHEAVKSEEYSFAAHLRDEAGAGLVGWWVARSAVESDKDPFGRLVHISHSQGRLTARAYTAKQIVAAAEGSTVFEVFVAEQRSSREGGSSAGSIRGLNTNSASLTSSPQFQKLGEDEKHRGRSTQFQKQAVFWKRQESARAAVSVLGRSTGAERIQEVIASLAREREQERRDRAKGDRDPKRKEEDDAERKGRLQPPGNSGETGSLSPSAGKGDDDEDRISKILGFFKERMPDVQLRVFRVGSLGVDDVQQGVEKDLPKIVEDMLELLRREKQRSAQDGISQENDGTIQGAKDGLSTPSGAGAEGDAGASVPPSGIGRGQQDRGPRADDGAGKDKEQGGGPSGKEAKSLFGSSPLRRGAPLPGPRGQDNGNSRRDSGGGLGVDDPSGDQQDQPGNLPVRVVVGGVLPVQGLGRGEPTPPVRVPASIEMKGRDSFKFTVEEERGDDSSKDGEGIGDPEFRRLTRSRTMTRQAAAEAALNLMPYDVAGVLFNSDRASRRAASHDKDLAHLIRSAVARVQRQSQGLPRIADFERIHTDGTNGDPLTGLYVGAFGPFTSEVVQLRRRFGRWEDDDVDETVPQEEPAEGGFLGKSPDILREQWGEMSGWVRGGSGSSGVPRTGPGVQKKAEMTGAPAYEYVEAVKLTGDLHVPSGQVAFRARISKKHRMSSVGIFPEELGVIARYPGEGRLAEAGFEKPRWVEGEIVLLDSKAAGFTNGAELGFVYSSSERHFLILFNRLKLQV